MLLARKRRIAYGIYYYRLARKSYCLRTHVGIVFGPRFSGKEMPGLAIDLIDITNKDDPVEYHSLTVSFGEFIGMKNCAYVDTNNCSFAEQLLKQGIATPTQFTKMSGFWEYPLWLFDEETLKAMGAEAYELYHTEYEKYMADKMPPADE